MCFFIYFCGLSSGRMANVTKNLRYLKCKITLQVSKLHLQFSRLWWQRTVRRPTGASSQSQLAQRSKRCGIRALFREKNNKCTVF